MNQINQRSLLAASGVLPDSKSIEDAASMSEGNEVNQTAEAELDEQPIVIEATVVLPLGNDERFADDSGETEEIVDAEVSRVYPATPVNVKTIQDGLYLNKKWMGVAAVSLLTVLLILIGAFVNKARTNSQAGQRQSPEPWWAQKRTIVERLARQLPSYTLKTLQNDLPSASRDGDWYYDALWGSKDFEPVSPQGKAWKWLISDPQLVSRVLEDAITRFSLATFYYATDGPNWKNNTNWLSTSLHVCYWAADNVISTRVYNHYLTRCFDSGEFAEIRLTKYGLHGSLPPESGLLTKLTAFRIDGNQLHGEAHEDVWKNWQKLTMLWLFENDFNGTLPKALGALTDIQDLRLHSNRFSGTIPATAIGKLANLWYFTGSDNKLSGQLPTEFELTKHLQLLHLSNNNINGSIPTVLGELSKLQILNLAQNSISGNLPRELSNASDLAYLFVDGNSLTGTLHSELGRLTKLISFRVNHTSIMGTVPSSVGQLSSLVSLDLSHTKLNGTLPTELGQLGRLDELFLQGSALTGNMPSGICSRIESPSSQLTADAVKIDCNKMNCSCGCSCDE